MKTRKVFVSRERLETALRLRNIKLKKMCDAIGYGYEVIRKSIRNELIMMDYLNDIALYLDVSTEYLQEQSPTRSDFYDKSSESVREELNENWYRFVDDKGYLMQIPDSAIRYQERLQRNSEMKDLILEYADLHGCELKLDEMDLNSLGIVFSKALDEYLALRKTVPERDRYQIIPADNFWQKVEVNKKGKGNNGKH